MSQPHLIGQAPVTLYNSEAMQPLGLKKLGEAYQDKLYRGDKKKVVMRTEKPCKICKVVKPLKCFSKHYDTKDGTVNRCKTCLSANSKKEWREKKL